MVWLIAGILVAVLLFVLLFALALGRASRRGRVADERTLALTHLNELKSPSGKPFYPTDNSLWELAEALDTLEARQRVEREAKREADDDGK